MPPRLTASSPSDVAAGAAPERRGRLLVCDDSASIRALMRSLLAPLYDVHLTASAEEALATAPGFGPDVILSDLLLPGMSGADLCRAVRGVPALAGIPFVLVTTFGGADARADGLEAGADDYLVKPILERELLARVASLVRLRRVLTALEQRTHELERANRALHDTRDQLVRAEKLAAVGTLAAGLAHEINNPLAYIKAGASSLGTSLNELRDAAESALVGGEPEAALRRRLADAYGEAREVAQAMAEGSRRLERLAADLRVVSWPSQHSTELVDPAAAIDVAWTLTRSRFAAALPRLELSVVRGTPIESSHALVTQALLPVLERAVAAAGPSGLVTVALEQIEGGVVITVHDSGPAIPAEALPRLFDPFFTTRAAPASGGLGLAVAYGIAHGLGGDITVASDEAHGSTFKLRLPRTPGAFVTPVERLA